MDLESVQKLLKFDKSHPICIILNFFRHGLNYFYKTNVSSLFGIDLKLSLFSRMCHLSTNRNPNKGSWNGKVNLSEKQRS